MSATVSTDPEYLPPRDNEAAPYRLLALDVLRSALPPAEKRQGPLPEDEEAMLRFWCEVAGVEFDRFRSLTARTA
jgi:hypothetical protein